MVSLKTLVHFYLTSLLLLNERTRFFLETPHEMYTDQLAPSSNFDGRKLTVLINLMAKKTVLSNYPFVRTPPIRVQENVF
jgi:hypothetical protein